MRLHAQAVVAASWRNVQRTFSTMRNKSKIINAKNVLDSKIIMLLSSTVRIFSTMSWTRFEFMSASRVWAAPTFQLYMFSRKLASLFDQNLVVEIIRRGTMQLK